MKPAFDPTGKKASEFEFYFGPNDFPILKNTEKESTFGKDLEFQKLVYLGWAIIRWINRVVTLYVFDWLSNVFPIDVYKRQVADEGKTLTLTYTLGDDYMLHMSLQANGMAGLFSPNYNKKMCIRDR